MMMTKSPPQLLLLENSHDDGSAAALQMLVSNFITWEILYQLSQFAIKLFLTKYPQLIVAKKAKGNTDDDAKTTLIERGPSYVVSLLHSMYVTSRGIMHLHCLWGASNIDKLLINDGDYRLAHLEVAQTNVLFLAYLLYDLIHIILKFPVLGGFDTIMHHILFAFCSVINGTYGIMPFQFGWLITGELSTIFLNWRWFLLKSGHDSGPLIYNINTMFAASFFLCRIIIYTAGIVHLYFFSLAELKSLLLPEVSGVSMSLLGITCGCMVLGWLLNIFWGLKILSKVIGQYTKTTVRIAKRD
jgi:hypothetical protein